MEDRLAEGEQTLVGVVDQVVFSNEETGWTVLRADLPAERRTIRATGVMPGLRVGDPVVLTGRWTESKRWGTELKVARYEVRVPSSEPGIRNYLSSGLVPGIGRAMAERLVDHFGAETLEVIDSNPERLLEVDGIGPKRAQAIQRALGEHRGLREVMVFLQGHGVAAGRAASIYKAYGADTVRQVQRNPYRLADDVFGIGFLTADRIAETLGVERRSPFRVQAGIVYELGKATEEGHLYLPEEILLSRTAERLAVDRGLVLTQLPELVQSGQVVSEQISAVSQSPPGRSPPGRSPPGQSPLGQSPPGQADHQGLVYYKPALFYQERALAEGLRRLQRAPLGGEPVIWDSRRRWLEQRLGLSLAGAQARAVACAVTEKVAVITGGPGTGKTTIIKGVLEVLEDMDLRVELAAPTGRAAKRMQEATGRPARTVHRLLEFMPAAGGFQRNADRPLDADLVVIDEVSMLDVPLAAALVRALPDTARLVLVGDADQLPSVGPGAVLREIIQSATVPCVRLTEVFRQAARSQIVVCAHQINEGKKIHPPPSSGEGDLFVVTRDDPQKALEVVELLVTERIPRQYGLDPVEQIQVLTPTHRGVTGTSNLNSRLQSLLNPQGQGLTTGDHLVKPGDKVMQIKNNYDKDVFNGDMGRVVTVDTEAKSLKVSFENRLVTYERRDTNQLMLAYACTVHKAQGSEYPAVVMPLLGEHHMLLQRNLLYTAVTRARRLLVLVASPKALARALRNDLVRMRYTCLARRLRGEL